MTSVSSDVRHNAGNFGIEGCTGALRVDLTAIFAVK